MNSSPPRSRPTRWVAALALLALMAGVGLALRPWPTRTATPLRHLDGRPTAPADTGDRGIGQALRQTEDDKSRWVDDVPGVDVSGLDSVRLAIFVSHANARRCTCGCGYTLAGCRAYDPTCEKSLPFLTALRDSICAGRLTSAPDIRSRPGRAGDGGGGGP